MCEVAIAILALILRLQHMLFADLQCWFTVKPEKNKYFRFKEKKFIPPGGELSVALTRHREACSSKPGVGGIFFLLWPFSVSHYLSLVFSSKVSSLPVHSLG